MAHNQVNSKNEFFANKYLYIYMTSTFSNLRF